VKPSSYGHPPVEINASLEINKRLQFFSPTFLLHTYGVEIQTNISSESSDNAPNSMATHNSKMPKTRRKPTKAPN
jgi:hypothetical protein